MARSPYYTVQVKETGRILTDLIGSMRYEDCLEKDDLVEFKIEKASIDLIDSKDVSIGHHLLFSYGNAGELNSGSRICVIKDHETNYGQNITFTLKCRDEGFYLKKGTSSKIHKNKTASQIVKDIADAHGFDCVMDETTKVYSSYPQGNKNYHQFCRELAKEECGGDEEGEHEFYVRGNTMYFVKKDLKKNSKRTLTYQDGNGPMKSFSPKYNQEKEGKSNQVTSFGVDKETGKQFEANTGEKELRDPQTGEYNVNYNWDGNLRGAAPSLGETLKNVKNIVTPGNNKDEALNTNKSLNKKSKAKELTCDIELELDPTYHAGDIVTVSNVAKKHSGNWRIIKVVSEISGSGASTKLECDKNGTSKSLHANPKKTNSDVNSTQGNTKGEVKKDVVNYNWDGKKR